MTLDNDPTSTNSYVGVIILHNEPAPLLFGPFSYYSEAENFIQQKALEYTRSRIAFVEVLCHPTLYPGRSVS